ncbi:MAG: VCBS repeat-containing protein, partial [Pirellulaceae bacterium]
YTNGDMFDRFYVAPYHGVHWLEQMADGSWKQHLLASMPGVHRAAVADLDNDGDLDLVACALISDNMMQKYDAAHFNSLIWIEQVGNGKFVTHALESGQCYHATADVADFDNDGDVDIAVGQFREISGAVRSDVTIWWNQTLSQPKKSAAKADSSGNLSTQ